MPASILRRRRFAVTYNWPKARSCPRTGPISDKVLFSLARQVKGFVNGRRWILSAIWNHPLNRGSKLRALRDYVLWNALRFSIDAAHIVPLPEGAEIIV